MFISIRTEKLCSLKRYFQTVFWWLRLLVIFNQCVHNCENKSNHFVTVAEKKQIRFKHFFLEMFQNHQHFLLINYSLKYIWIIFWARAEVYFCTSILKKQVWGWLLPKIPWILIKVTLYILLTSFKIQISTSVPSFITYADILW